MKTTATITGEGQLTLPKEVRERLGVQQGDAVEFTLDEHGVRLRPVRRGDNPFLAWIDEGSPSGEFHDALEARHEGLSEQELEVLRAGPGATVVRLGEEPR